MNKQELMMEVQEMARQTEQIEQHCEFLDQQINELAKFKDNLDKFDAKPKDSMLASLGKGVFMETELKSNSLFVEVGAGVLVRKTPKEVSDILSGQIGSLRESRLYFGEQFDGFRRELEIKMRSLEREMEGKAE